MTDGSIICIEIISLGDIYVRVIAFQVLEIQILVLDLICMCKQIRDSQDSNVKIFFRISIEDLTRAVECVLNMVTLFKENIPYATQIQNKYFISYWKERKLLSLLRSRLQ